MSVAAEKVESNNAGADGASNSGADDNAKNGGQNPDNANNGDSGNSGDGGADDKNTPSIYKPAGLAEHLMGANDQETIDKLNAAVLGFRKDLSKKGVPEKADGYELKLPDEIKDKVLRLGEDGKDQMVEKMKPIFHKHNISAGAFQDIVMEVYQAVAENAAAVGDSGESTADFEYKSFGGKEKVQASLDGAEVWINGLLQNEKISETSAKELKLMSSYGEGLKALLELRTMSGEAAIPADFKGNAPEKITKEILDSRVADKKYWLDKDPEFIRATTEMFEKFYGSSKK